MEGGASPSQIQTGRCASSIIRNASGGLALRGIFLSRDPEELCKERKTVLEVQGKVDLLSSSKPLQDLTVQFESVGREKRFQQCVHRTGVNISGGLSARRWDCGVDFKASKDSSQLSNKSASSNRETTYASVLKYSSVPMGSCELNARELRLTPDALDRLKQLHDTLRYEHSDAVRHRQCADFLNSYGSHVNCGTIVFGGIFETKVETSKFKEDEKSSVFQMLNDVLQNSVKLNLFGIVNFNIESTITSSFCSQNKNYSHKQLRNTIISICKMGGPSTVSDLSEWKKGLPLHPETWHLIDRGPLDKLVPVWEILSNHVNDLEDSAMLAQNLRKSWEKETNLLDKYPGTNQKFSLLEIEEKIASLQILTSQPEDTFFKQCATYVSECQRFKLSLGCSELLWYEKFLCATEVQWFIEKATQCIDQCEDKKYLKMMIYSLLEPVKLIQTTKFPNIAQILSKVTDSSDEQNLWHVTVEEAMRIVRETKIKFFKAGPEDTETQRRLCLQLHKTIDALQLKLKEREKYPDCLVTGILKLPFNGPQENPKYSLTHKDLESLLCHLEKIESILETVCQLNSLNDTQHQAYLIYEAVKSLREAGWGEKDCCTGVKILCRTLGNEISPKIKEVILNENDNVKVDLKNLEDQLFCLYKDELPASTRKATEQKKELLEFLNELDHAESMGSEYQFTKGNSDHAIQELLQQLEMNDYYPGKLALREVLDLGPDSVTDEIENKGNRVIWSFIRKVLMANSMARKVAKPTGKDVATETEARQTDESELLDVNELFNDEEQCTDHAFHPLDITVMVLLCSDQLLQQELMSKMSMCQFAVPFLIPNSFEKDVSFLLWALRGIVKKWTPQELAPSRGFVEDNVVATKMPVVSFVRLGTCKESKSKILNEILSDGQLNFFVNRHMEQGDVNRKISDGVAEMCWYLPSGDGTLDLFSKAFAVVNLRGDASQYSSQLHFLTEVSSATFMFVDKIGKKEKEFIESLSSVLVMSKLFLVMNISQSDKTETSNNMKSVIELLQLKKDQFVQFGKSNTDILKRLHERVSNEVQTPKKHLSLEEMADIARKHGIFVDEDEHQFKKSKCTVKEMMDILDAETVTDFKKNNLHYQGEQWKAWSKIDKEQSRLRHRGAEPSGSYIDSLEVKKKKLREEQLGFKVSNFMIKFIEQMHSPDNFRKFFMQWLKLELDSRSRKNLKALHSKYKELCDSGKTQAEEEKLKNLDREIPESSLGLEHLLREVGQIYEATASNSTPQERSQYQQLPRYAAELMLDGVPLELIDGDASNIPLQWVTNVLQEISDIIGKESRMFVVTVLGVQSTGKSTLLNTMFGLQFAVSSGRCTRGAFMQLLRVKDDLQKKLGCDFVMVIDTEGLKAPELSQRVDSYEHDNELATLVIGLSDLTLVNMSSENSTEMKDILQIVVHAFIRMREVGKRPNCQFIHQNAGDVAVHEKNFRDRKYFLDQLNEMTKAAARMEGREGSYSSFGDVMEYDSSKSNWYIGNLWHGNPPMAAVSPGYCKNTLDLKKHIFDCLEKRKHRPGTIHNFGEWLKNIWAAVKKENFIFSFKNSLVAEAYNDLSLQYCDWEWELREHVMTWTQQSEIRIKNASQADLDTLKSDLECDLNVKLNEKIGACIQKLKEYFSSGKDNVHMVERYKVEFQISLETLGKELKNTSISKCSDTISRQKGLQKLIQIQRGYQQLIEDEVKSLLMACKKQKKELNNDELEVSFNHMWREVTSKFPNTSIQKRDIAADMENALWHTTPATSSVIPGNLHLIKMDCLDTFTVKQSHVELKSSWKGMVPGRIQNHFKDMELAGQVQTMFVFNIKKILNEKVKDNINYDQNFCQEMLREVDYLVKNHANDSFKFNESFRTDFKLYFSGHAVKRFEEMQDRFYSESDPVEKLGRQKTMYLEIFKDTYCKRDQTQKKAEMFCEDSLKPAVRDCVRSKLGAALLEDLRCNRMSLALSTSKFFHVSLLVHLLEEDCFSKYYRYINHYEDFAIEWVKECVVKHCADETDNRRTRMAGLAVDILKRVSYTAKEAIKDAGACTVSNKLEDFLDAFVAKMDSELVIPTDNLEIIAFQSDGNIKDFVDAILVGVNEIEKAMEDEIARWDVEQTISELPTKPTDELVKSLLNCRKQCPFCHVPCERAGLNHSDHFSEYHIPDGLSGYINILQVLSTEICTISVTSAEKFKNEDTDYKYVSYKNYKSVNDYYKSWQIQADSSYKASSYWKYVFHRFNRDFAQRYGVKPAEIPEGWNITKEQVRNDLQEAYKVSLDSVY